LITQKKLFVQFSKTTQAGSVASVRCSASHLCSDRLFQITDPTKTQVYMTVGKPVLMAVKSGAAGLILPPGGGVVAEFENSISLDSAPEALHNLSATDPCIGKRKLAC
jgi:hypothetical protein